MTQWPSFASVRLWVWPLVMSMCTMYGSKGSVVWDLHHGDRVGFLVQPHIRLHTYKSYPSSPISPVPSLIFMSRILLAFRFGREEGLPYPVMLRGSYVLLGIQLLLVTCKARAWPAAALSLQHQYLIFYLPVLINHYNSNSFCKLSFLKISSVY